MYSSTAIIFVQHFTSCSLMPGAISFLSLLSNQCNRGKSWIVRERSVYKYFTRLVSARSILESASLITFLLWSIGSRTAVREANLRSSRLKWSQQAGKHEFYGQTPLTDPPPPNTDSLLCPRGKKAVLTFSLNIFNPLYTDTFLFKMENLPSSLKSFSSVGLIIWINIFTDKY